MEDDCQDEVALTRLSMERKMWRRNHPHGFVAKPEKKEIGGINMFKWRCEIPGPKNSIWERGMYKLHMDFPKDYPLRPPRCYFRPIMPHPNVYPSGTVCLSILNEEEDWKPGITVKMILLGIQKMLKEEPNLLSPAQLEPTQLYKKDRDKYEKQGRDFAISQRKRKC